MEFHFCLNPINGAIYRVPFWPSSLFLSSEKRRTTHVCQLRSFINLWDIHTDTHGSRKVPKTRPKHGNLQVTHKRNKNRNNRIPTHETKTKWTSMRWILIPHIQQCGSTVAALAGWLWFLLHRLVCKNGDSVDEADGWPVRRSLFLSPPDISRITLSHVIYVKARSGEQTRSH